MIDSMMASMSSSLDLAKNFLNDESFEDEEAKLCTGFIKVTHFHRFFRYVGKKEYQSDH